MSLSFTFKLLKGGNAPDKEHSSPESGVCRNSDFRNRRDPIVAKAVKMADICHNPDPLI